MKKTIVFLFLVSVFLLSFLPVKDTDFGWHYRCGQRFIYQGKICIKNEFSYFLPEYHSSNPSFFYDVVLAFTYDRLGFVGVSALGAIIFSLSALLIIKLFKTGNWLAMIGFFLSYFLSYSTFSLGLRSQIITYFFFLLTLYLLHRSRKNKFYLIFLPFLFLIWVNTHIGFFIGPIVFGLYFIDFFLTRKKGGLFVFILMLISFLATLINPFGFSVYQEIVNHAFSPLNHMIAEWVEPDRWQIVLMVLLLIVTLIIFVKQKSFSFFSFFLIFFFLLLGVKARRNLPFFYLTLFYFLAPTLPRKYDRHQIVDRLTVSILVSLIIFLLIIQIPKTLQFDNNWNEYCNNGGVKLPCETIKNFRHLSGNVYAAYEWGGFLIWQKPNIKVFVDGRMPAWKDENGKSPYQVYLEIIQTQPGWNEKLNKLKTNYLLIQKGTFLDLLLQREAKKFRWREEYRDQIAVVYKHLK